MSGLFRLVLIAVSLFTLWYILKKIRNAKVQIEDSIFWILFSVALMVLSVFPIIADMLSKALGIYSTTNFIFLFMIFVLLIRLFNVTLKFSKVEQQVKQLTQEIALEKNKTEKKEEL